MAHHKRSAKHYDARRTRSRRADAVRQERREPWTTFVGNRFGDR